MRRESRRLPPEERHRLRGYGAVERYCLGFLATVHSGRPWAAQMPTTGARPSCHQGPASGADGIRMVARLCLDLVTNLPTGPDRTDRTEPAGPDRPAGPRTTWQTSASLLSRRHRPLVNVVMGRIRGSA